LIVLVLDTAPNLKDCGLSVTRFGCGLKEGGTRRFVCEFLLIARRDYGFTEIVVFRILPPVPTLLLVLRTCTTTSTAAEGAAESGTLALI
jgi:hypothetical protein